MSQTAEHVDEIQNEISIEIYDVTQEILMKCQRIVEAKMMALDQGLPNTENMAAEIAMQLELADNINEKLQVFRARFNELKDKAIKEFKKIQEKDLKEEFENETKAIEKAEEKDNRKEKSKKSKKKRK